MAPIVEKRSMADDLFSNYGVWASLMDENDPKRTIKEGFSQFGQGLSFKGVFRARILIVSQYRDAKRSALR
jgi:hypothetical protein